MKKIVVLVSMMLLVAFVSNTYAQKDRTLSNGFSINIVTGFPSASFGAPKDVSSDEKYGALFGLKLGNRWYFAPQEKYGLA